MRSSRPFSFSFLFTGLLLFGCSATAAPTDPIPAKESKLAKPDAQGRVSLAVSGQAEVAPGLLLTFERVVADSRCPVDVTCVWAGEIRVALSLDSPRSEAPRLEFELATTAPVTTSRGLEFRLLDASPVPSSKTKISASDYRISLHIGPAGSEQPKTGGSS